MQERFCWACQHLGGMYAALSGGSGGSRIPKSSGCRLRYKKEGAATVPLSRMNKYICHNEK